MGQPWVDWIHTSPRRSDETAAILEMRRIVDVLPNATLRNVSPEGVTFTVTDALGHTDWLLLKPRQTRTGGVVALVRAAPEPEPKRASWLPAPVYNQLLATGLMQMPPLVPRREL